MVNTIAKRIQTRLSRAGVKVALGDIKEYLKINVSNVETISDSDINLATDYFMRSASQLTVINEDLSTSVDNVDSEEIVIGGGDLAIATGDDHDYPEQSRSGELTHTANQSQLITTTADQMGIVLDASEISQIAENINDSSDDFDQDIDAIRSAIIAFVEHKAMINQSKINNLIVEVREVVGKENQRNSRLLSEGLNQINSDIQQANKDFKSSVRQALSAFNIPSIKAG